MEQQKHGKKPGKRTSCFIEEWYIILVFNHRYCQEFYNELDPQWKAFVEDRVTEVAKDKETGESINRIVDRMGISSTKEQRLVIEYYLRYHVFRTVK